MCVCACVCVFACVFVCVFTLCVYVCVCVRACVHVRVCVVRMCLCVLVHEYVRLHVCTYVHVFVGQCVRHIDAHWLFRCTCIRSCIYTQSFPLSHAHTHKIQLEQERERAYMQQLFKCLGLYEGVCCCMHVSCMYVYACMQNVCAYTCIDLCMCEHVYAYV